MKQAQSIAINTVIIMVLCLLVLGVLAFVFMQRAGVFSAHTQQCEQVGGECMSVCSFEKPIVISGVCAEGLVCCTG
ncbi:MAG: hypothetical protein ACMXYC_00915 [Candidatus Woesearchaeota archaeon]